jgi:hypothetical protein
MACFLEGASAARFYRQYFQAVDSGSEVLTVKNQDGELISARLCQLIGQADGVKASGGIRFRQVVHSTLAPGVAIQTASASPGYFQIIAPSSEAIRGGKTAVLVGAAIARDVGLVAGQTLATVEEETWPVDEIVNLSNRAAQQNRWIIWTAADQQVDQCWIEAEVGAKEDVAALAQSYFGATDEHTKIAALTPHDASGMLKGWTERFDRWAWAAGALVTMIMLTIVWISRRNEFALRRVIGFSQKEVSLQLVFEWLMICIVAGLIVTAWLTLWIVHSDQPRLISYYCGRVLVQYFGLILSASTILSLPFSGGNLIKRLRDR